MSHEPVEGSGGGGCSYNDDEDCYSDDDTYYENYYEYEGSGSGCGDGNSDDECKNPEQNDNNSGSKSKLDHQNKKHNKQEEDDEEEENWPPWVTAKPETENKINDIEMVDENVKQIIKPKPRKPSFNRSGPNLTGSVSIVTSATLLAIYFAVNQVLS